MQSQDEVPSYCYPPESEVRCEYQLAAMDCIRQLPHFFRCHRNIVQHVDGLTSVFIADA